MSAQNFEEMVLQASEPVVVDFHAPWCGYCRRLSPAVDRIQKQYDGKVRIVKIDIDEEPKLADQYKIDTIPTLMLFRQGKAVDHVVNPQSQSEIDRWLKNNGIV